MAYIVTICISHPSPVSAWCFLSSWPCKIQLDRVSALWVNFFCLIWSCHFLARRVGIKGLVVVDNGVWDWANPEHLIDFTSFCIQRTPWIWPDRAAGWHLRLPEFADIFVSTFAGCGDIFCLLPPWAWYCLLVRSPWTCEMQLDRASALWMSSTDFVAFGNAIF